MSSGKIASSMATRTAQNLWQSRRETTILLLILLLAFGLRLFRLGHQSLWWDEMWTAAISTLPLPDLLEESLADRVHPPLYALAVHFWVRLGHSEFILRYFSLIFGMLAVAIIYLVGNLVGNRKVGRLAALLLAVSPFHIWFSQEARMYTFVATAVLAANWFFLRALEKDNNAIWLGYALFMAIALYTHYLSLFILLGHYGFFAIHYRRFKRLFLRWLIFAGVATATLGAWMVPIVLTGGLKSTAIGWIPPAGWTHPFFTLLSLSVGPTIDPTQALGYVALLLFLVGLSFSFYRFGRVQAATTMPKCFLAYRALLCWLVVPFLLVFFISLDLPLPQKRSIYMDRYLIVLLPPLILLVAWGIVSLAKDRVWLLTLLLSAIVLPEMASLQNQYYEPAYARTDWRGALDHLGARWQTDDRLLITPEQSLPLLYYKNPNLSYELMTSSPVEMQNDLITFRRDVESQLAAIATQSDRVWIIRDFANNDPHGFSQRRNAAVANVARQDTIKMWLDGHYEPVEDWDFTGIHLTLYDVSGIN